MKKIGKLQIDPGKLIKNEELLRLKGGYSTWCCEVTCEGYHEDDFRMSSNCWQWWPECAEGECAYFFNFPYTNCQCDCGYEVCV